ncbi:MAG: carboxylesterase family protein [Synergistaceae bacterium]|nr:carboxylesterase family protein [Synergistaceae bacterium]
MNFSKRVLNLLLTVLVVVSFAACTSAAESERTFADLVVYGKIFTSESEGSQIVEAFAVKDGKYIYAGDKKGAEAFIEDGRTEVIDYTGKGLIMPGCGNGHAHYMLGYALKTIGTTIGYGDDSKKFMNEILPAAVKKAKESGAKAVFGQGWSLMHFGDHIPTRQELDAVCSDLPMYFLDDECHKALTNTCMLVKAGIMKEDGTAGRTKIRGGEIQVDANGIPTGFLSEQAQTYVRSFLDDIYTLDMSIANIAEIEHHMLSSGYTMYHEGWGNYFVNTNYYEALQQLDKAGKLHFVAGLPYEIESWMDMDEALARAVDAKKFASKRVFPRWIKLLMDGTVESGTGFVEPLYPDGHQGIANWTEEEITELTRKANEKGLTIHIHAMGNKAVNCAVSAFVNGGKDEMRNTIVHLTNVNEEDYKRMADHNIYVTSGITWHHGFIGMADYFREHGTVPLSQAGKSYPFKSFFDNNIPVSIHSDYPALSGSPDDPFGIMEIAVTGVLWSENGTPWWPEELVTREQALTAMTIGCARQMFIEDERGSIKPGKYADFLLLNKDILTCPAMEIHSARPEATYFEGKKVFEAARSAQTLDEIKAELRAQYGENKKITDGNYDKSLAVKCINGTFVGKKNDGVIAYKGIPFVGRQPVGELRWKAPVDVIPDDGIYEAYYNAKTAPQMESVSEGASLYVQGEDCLFLNVLKVDESPAGKKPVMVWIHGGAFEMGGTADPLYDLHNFVKENPDIIAVSITYRLGVFGFFHLSHLPDGKDYPDAQNLGIMDQIMALKWIHENIAGFGGDPDNVTIFGESAGGGSVTLLPLVKGSHAYFKRVIAQSGSPVFTRSTEQAIECTNELMHILGCKTVADLQKIDVEKLIQASIVLGLRVWAERDGKYLPLDPYEAYANGAAKDIDILQGCNKDEMGYFVYFFGVDNYNQWADNRKANKMSQLTNDEKALVESFCKDARDVSPEYSSTTRLFDQIVFIAPLFRMSENQTKAGGKSYTYFFTPESSLPIMRCGHAVELAVVLNHPENTIYTGRAFDETFSKTVRKMWVQFAKTGNPSLTAEISPDGKAHEWPLYDLKDKKIMILDEFNIHPEKESDRKILDWERTYFITKYFCI